MEGLSLDGMMDALPEYGGSGNSFKSMCEIDTTNGELKRRGVHLKGHNPKMQSKFRQKSWQGWSSWDFKQPILMEKDPPNLLRMRFMQQVFGQTHDVFAIFTMKHPMEIGSRYECDPTSKTRFEIVGNWLNCQRLWLKDLQYIKNYLIIPYEAWFLRTKETMSTIHSFLNLRSGSKADLPRRLSLWNYTSGFLLRRDAFAMCNRKFKAAFQLP
eukprot:CAMPEP_0183583394 /NCGR_PEP_ID=MMETSP0371-20130417/151553_1 /TAXON_ID=268820 /ORGANISM="Peridinium aciculiferum, Strain PAER-2" /LENGTH=212 /DNA_ID=CAMNT_0025794231 /DNA_START=27 /DNA_END=661 /DNA_ORIENTATION=-